MNNHNETFRQIGLKIMYCRKEKDITQLKLAELTSYSRNHIQQIETANTNPHLKNNHKTAVKVIHQHFYSWRMDLFLMRISIDSDLALLLS